MVDARRNDDLVESIYEFLRVILDIEDSLLSGMAETVIFRPVPIEIGFEGMADEPIE